MVGASLVVLGLLAEPFVAPDPAKFDFLLASTSGSTRVYTQRQPERLPNGRFRTSFLFERQHESHFVRFEVDCEARRSILLYEDYLYERRVRLRWSLDGRVSTISEGSPLYDRTCLR